MLNRFVTIAKISITILLVLLAGTTYYFYSWQGLGIYLFAMIIFEASSYFLTQYVRKKFPWFITPKDEHPSIDVAGLDKFLPHGFDPELGWVRKPNTEKEEIGKWGKTWYHIDGRGRRKNPEHESLPELISCYGDSFTFARQVNDNETWEWYLSKLTKSNAINFGVGNYGLDQSLIHLKRDYPHNKTPIVIMGVVPSTIVRVMCLWKHYNEFGNTFAFKPMFKLENGKLILIKNIITDRQKFLELEQQLEYFRKNDYFYHFKFRQEMIRFPYFLSLLSYPSRNFRLIYFVLQSVLFEKEEATRNQPYPTPMKVIMEVNLKLRKYLFTKEPYAVDLMTALVEEFIAYSKSMNFTPVFLLMPQKDDVLYIKEKKDYFYTSFVERIQNKLTTIDFTPALVNASNFDDLYSDDNKYGGHYSKAGNELLAKIISEELKKKKILKKQD